MLKYIRNKINTIVVQYNVIDKKSIIESSTYISGSKIYGDIKIEKECKIYQSHLEGKITIGQYSSLWGPGIFVIGRINGIEIGKYCSIARYVSIQEDYHNTNRVTTYFLERNFFNEPLRDNAETSKGKIIIKNDVWIGTGAQILSGVTIENGAVVAAGAIVTKDVPPYAVVAGNPAKVVKYRFEEKKKQDLLDMAWWDWSIEKIKENKEFILSNYDRNND